MSAIGETLRRERLRRNLDLEKISRELKISLKFLEAIEHEQFGKLPGGVFAKSFVRQYARLLGLDEEELAVEVQRAMDPPQSVPQFAEVSRQPPVDIHVPRVEAWQYSGESRWSSSLPALAGLVVVMLVCSGLYAWWQRQRSMVSAHQDAAAAVQTAQTAQNQPAPATEPPPPAPTAAAEPAAPQPDRVPDSSTSAGRPAAPQASLPPNPNATVHLQVTADETVWMLVRADDKYLFSGTLEANQTRTVEATDKVLLRLGNAGGVTITLNGKPIGSVGPKGQVRTVQFTSGGFQIVAVPKPSLPLEDNL